MTLEHDPQMGSVVAWLREDAHENAERVLLAALSEVDRTQQRRSWWPAWRFADMNNVAKILVATAVVVAVAFVGINMLPASGTGPGAQPTPSPSPLPTPTASTVAGLPEGPFAFEDRGTAMTVTIPAPGWTFDREYTALVKGTEVRNLPEATILMWSFDEGTRFHVYGDPCQATSTKPDAPATTVDEIAAGLAAQASRDASEPADVTIGGYAGKSIILHVPVDADFEACEENEFVTYGTDDEPFTRWQQGVGQIDELWILDVDGAIVILDAMYRPDSAPAIVDEMRAIAESLTFETP